MSIKNLLMKKTFLLAPAVGALCVCGYGYFFINDKLYLTLVGVVSALVILFYMIVCFCFFYLELVKLYSQLDALQSLHAVVKIRKPLPIMRSWAVSPDFVNIIVSEILDHKPKIIVELGCGVSTLVMGYLLEGLGNTTLYSFEHDLIYLEKTRQNLEAHGLTQKIKLIHAPLIHLEVNLQNHRWYDIEKFNEIESIDLLIVDGPPGWLQKLARFPALPLLIKKLSSKATALVDDTFRKDETTMLQKWAKLYPHLLQETIETEKGACILRKKS
ncbi:MAG TPA: hypothetical protein DDW49_08610 [Deltaproteobacteria bacterium]|nr:MAG: hypothetical protein A2048_03370 [Deltaproteobacteria bacterium GWA2_45_12]HBF13426.1 hypothetical protein [Deltaproteobacteria bacterium]